MKNKLSRFSGIFMIAAMLQAGMPCYAEPLPPQITSGTYGVLDYEIVDESYVVIKGCKEGSTEIEIPIEIDGYPVQDIQAVSFSSPDLTAIYVEEGHPIFTSVDGVLFDTAMSRLYRYPFGKGASYEVPEGVKFIGHDAFMGLDLEGNVNTTLEEVTFPDSLLKIEMSAFAGCCALRSIAFPDECGYLGSYAFQDCIALESVSLGEGTAAIQDNTFYGCMSLLAITADGSRYSTVKDGVLYSLDGTALELYPAAKEDTAFTVPKGVTTIRGGAFSSCMNLTEVVFQKGVNKFDGTTFFRCPNLQSITIPEGVTAVDSLALECEALETISLPSTLDYVGWMVVRDCSQLKEISYNGTRKMWEEVDNSHLLSEKYNIQFLGDAKPGDMSGNGSIDILDCIMMQKYLLGNQEVNAVQLAGADLSGDGIVNAFDLALLKSKLIAK